MKRAKHSVKRYATDPQYKISIIMRSRFKKCLNGCKGKKTTSVLKLLGCTLDEFKKYIEYKWKPGMSWENYNHKIWHLDHIKPLACFDMTKEEDQRQAWHWTNFQPLWASENMSKGAKYVLP